MTTENKKIKNATPKEFDGINFKSVTEVRVYKTLLSAGFSPRYEAEKFRLWAGMKPTVPFYVKDRKTGVLVDNSKKLINITYTPDFTFTYKNYFIIIEVKGFANDTFPIKEKLFRKLLEDNKEELHPLFFKVSTKEETLQAINIIKSL